MKIDKNELHELFKGLKGQSRTAFEVLYKKYNRVVYKIAFSILHNKENSEDVMQSVYSKIYELPLYQLPDKYEATWLYTVTKNEAISYLRNSKENFDIDTIYNIETTNDEIEKLIDNDRYNKIIDKLSTKEQEIVSLKIIGQMTFREISKLLKIPIGTVQWYYYKALDSIKILISNISMFVVTMFLYLRNQKTKNGALEKLDENTIMEQDEVNVIITGNEIQMNSSMENEKNKENMRENETQIDNITIDSNITEEEESNTQEHEQIQIEYEVMEPGRVKSKFLLGTASVFFIFIIIFSVICIKHQQNRRNKTSKH